MMNLLIVSAIANIVSVCFLATVLHGSGWRLARSKLRFAICNGVFCLVAILVWPCFATTNNEYSDVYPPNLANPIAIFWVLHISPHVDSLPVPTSGGFVQIVLLPNAAAFCFGSAMWAGIGFIIRWFYSRYSIKSGRF